MLQSMGSHRVGYDLTELYNSRRLPKWFSGKESICQCGRPGFNPWVEGKSPGGRNGYPLQYSGLGNSMDRGPGRLQSVGSQRVRHDLATKQQSS